jgi:iron complex outermembrane recepter protein
MVLRSKFSGVIVVFGALAVAVCATKARAQQDAPNASGSALEEIIVTATKREEPIDKVPASIVALSQGTMELAHAINIDDLAALSPGVEFNRTNWAAAGISVISFRGITSEAGESTTGVYIDDTAVQSRINTNGLTYFGNPYPITFDLNRVEFDRGPQGTLFGAGAEGGAVRFIFNQPSLQEFSGEARSEISQTVNGGPSYEAGVAAGGPIVQGTLGFRMSAYYRTDGGYINRLDPFTGGLIAPNSNSTDSKAFRLAFTGAITDGLTITPSFYYQSVYSHDANSYTEYTTGRTSGPFSNASAFNSGQLLQQPTIDTFYLPAININADLGAVKLTSITSYFSRTGTTVVDVTRILGAFSGGYGNPLGLVYPSSYADAAPQYGGLGQQVFTQETRFASSDPTASLTWVGGLFYSRRLQHETIQTFSPTIATENALPADSDVLYAENFAVDTQEAVFGQADYSITNKLKATAGVRVSVSRTSLLQYNGGFFNTGTPYEGYGSTKETPVTPKFGLSYQADDRNLYYLSIAKGFRDGGENTPEPNYCQVEGGTPSTYKSDTVWSYEIGAKNKLLDDRLQISSSIYHINWRNIQEHLGTTCGFYWTQNTGSAVSNGFDFSIKALVTQALRVDFSVAYTDARLSQNIGFDGVPVVDRGDAIGTNPNVPAPWNITLAARYDVPLSATINGYLWANDIYHSSNPGPFANDIPGGISYFPEYVQNPSTNILNFRAGLVRGGLELSLFVNNVLNSHPLLDRYVDSPSSTIVDYATFRPRTVGLNVDYHF